MLLQSNWTEPNQLNWHNQAGTVYGMVIIGTVHQSFILQSTTKRKVNSTMATPVNWTREKTFTLISLWNEDVIQQQLEGCRKNNQVYRKIPNDLGKFAIVQLPPASAFLITYSTCLTLQLFLQQKVSSKTIVQKLKLHPSLLIVDIVHINYNNFIICTSATMQFVCVVKQCEHNTFLYHTVLYWAEPC